MFLKEFISLSNLRHAAVYIYKISLIEFYYFAMSLVGFLIWKIWKI